MKQEQHALVRQLPANLDELHKAYPMPGKPRVRNIIDEVHELHKELWVASEDYRRLFEGVNNAGCKEGSLIVDAVMAAEMLRAHAETEARNTWVAGKNLTDIKYALHRVRRREGISIEALRGQPERDNDGPENA